MIVSIDDSFLKITDESKKIDEALTICRILENGHYIKIDNNQVRLALDAVVNQSVTPALKAIYQSARNLINPSKNKLKYFTVLNWSQLTEESKRILLFKPSELLVENAPYEWNVYRKIITQYCNDKIYGDIFTYIDKMIKKDNLVPANAGGKNTIISMIQLKDSGEYSKLYRYKSCTIFDRDTDDSISYDENNDSLFDFFCQKNHNDIGEKDIYTLDFGEGYIYHMWFKRAIENYIPVESYEVLHVDMGNTKDKDYDYFRFSSNKKKGLPGYRKEFMRRVLIPSNEKLDSTTKHFSINGVDYSEMQLLLLKIAKII